MITQAVRLEIFKNIFQEIAEEMGVVLRRSAFSVNIKERCDFSCAVFDSCGNMVAQAAHIPVHLGSMMLSVQRILGSHKFSPGDVVFLNDPFSGGTHLPDITVVSACFSSKGKKPLFYLANRAHHADIGGIAPGSMAVSTEIFQEGLIIPPTLICERGRLREDILNLIQANVRTPQERRGDILAQIASCRRGEERLSELLKKMKPSVVSLNARGLLDYSEKMMRSSLSKIPLGSYEFEDCLDDDGISDKRLTIRVRVTVSRRGVVVDFSGTDAQTDGAVNCTLAVTLSAVYYCFLCLAGEMIPPNSGCFRPIRVIVPEGTLLNPRFPAAVAGGNVETSQRIVDVLFGALSKALPDKIPAASSGSMSNVGVGGIDPASGKPFTYYETIAGGSGASGGYDGESAVQTHMTNTLNTPIEVLEQSFPLQVLSYRIRAGSGGAGRFRGGDGIIREIKLLTDARISILSDRRKFAPYGLLGGASGRKGRNSLLLPDGRDFEELPSKTVVSARSGTVLRIETPGGGGFGTPCEQDIPTEQDWR